MFSISENGFPIWLESPSPIGRGFSPGHQRLARCSISYVTRLGSYLVGVRDAAVVVTDLCRRWVDREHSHVLPWGEGGGWLDQRRSMSKGWTQAPLLTQDLLVRHGVDGMGEAECRAAIQMPVKKGKLHGGIKKPKKTFMLMIDLGEDRTSQWPRGTGKDGETRVSLITLNKHYRRFIILDKAGYTTN